MRDSYRLITWYGLSLVIIAADQTSKFWVQANLNYAEPNPVLTWLNFTLHYNEGAAFSFLSEAGGWQRWFFSSVALIASAVLVVWLYIIRHSQGCLPFGLAFILGGALGNVWDRLEMGYVVDFVSVHLYDWYFPTFNVADSAISVGVCLVLLDGFFSNR